MVWLQLKRQIYREQVLPSSGGKIPDGAFATDRLALNKLNKAGIAIPDGVLLEHRHTYAHPHSNQHDPEDEVCPNEPSGLAHVDEMGFQDSLVKIVQRPEDRYVPSVGTYHNQKPLTVSSTYIIRKPTHTTNIKTPHQQMPLHEFLGTRGAGYEYSTLPTSEWRPFRFEENVLPAYGAVAPIRGYYPEIKESVAYYPITVPLEIPNKKTPKGGYPQGGVVHYQEPEDIHKSLDWPFLLKEYTRLVDEINTINHTPYGQNQHSLFFTPEVRNLALPPLERLLILSVFQVVPPFDSYFYGPRQRYARKSKEISFTDLTSDGNRVKSKDSRRVIKLRCTLGAENTVDGHDTKCRLRY